jgi:predicted PurR-regulated permease PerM
LIRAAIFAPVAFALLIIAIVWPLQSRLQTVLPNLIVLAILIVITVVVFLAFASLVAWSFGRVGRWVVANAAQF